MSYVEIADGATVTGPDPSVKLWISPDMAWGYDDTDVPGWDWIADGYVVLRVGPGRHDNTSATVLTLADSDGQREVGILRLRNDALRDARLEVTRQFETNRERDEFVTGLNARPEGLPDGYEQVEARTVMVGDSIWVESDPDDDDLADGTVTIKEVDVDVYEGKVQVTLVRDEETASTFMPGEFSDHAPDEKIWVKRA
jgi:hypothetical protein